MAETEKRRKGVSWQPSGRISFHNDFRSFCKRLVITTWVTSFGVLLRVIT